MSEEDDFQFDIGDSVKLKSGGPEMTVHSRKTPGVADDERSYYCKWFSGKKVQLERFSESTLKAEEGEEN